MKMIFEVDAGLSLDNLPERISSKDMSFIFLVGRSDHEFSWTERETGGYPNDDRKINVAFF